MQTFSKTHVEMWIQLSDSEKNSGWSHVGGENYYVATYARGDPTLQA
jgi:hypothetical protein